MTIKKTKYRAGLHVFERTTVSLDDTSAEALQAIDAMLDAAAPEGRLGRIKAKASRHPMSPQLTEEIGEVGALLQVCNGSPQTWDAFDRIDSKLKALERGFALLDTTKHWAAVLQVLRRNQESKSSGEGRAKLPRADKLRRRIRESNTLSSSDAKKLLADAYGVTVAAIYAKLRRSAAKNE